MNDTSNYWDRWNTRRLSRRRMLTATGGAAAGSLALIAVGCGDDDDDSSETPTGPTSAASQVVKPKKGGTLSISSLQDPTALDGNYARSAGDTGFLRPLYDTLTYFDDKSEMHPRLATQWQQPDNMTWVFTLRDDVKFHDGTAFDAISAKTYLDMVRDPAFASTQRTELDPISSIEASDAKTLRINLKAPFSPLPAALFGRAGMFVSPTAMSKFGKDTATNPVGTGPFKFGSFVPGAHVKLIRNENYWDKERINLDEIEFRILKDPETALATFESGGIDALGSVAPGSVERASKVAKSTIVEREGSSRNGFLFQTSKAPFNDANLRRAVSNAAGYEDVLAVALRGRGNIRPMNFWYPWGWAWYEDVAPLKKDLAKAKQFLAAAGKPDGFEFTVTVLTPQPDLDVLRTNLAQVGIKMKDEILEVGAYAARNTAKDWQSQYTAKSPNATMDPGLWAKRFLWTKGAFATSGIVDDEMDKLILQGEQESSVDKRKPLYQEVNKRWFAQGQNDSPLFMSSYAAQKDVVQGLVVHPEGVVHIAEAWKS